MAEDNLFRAWAAGKRVNLEDVEVTGTGDTLNDLYEDAKKMNEFDLKNDLGNEILFKASLYLLYRKFYSQLHKRSGKKGTTITSTSGKTMTVQEETNQSENGKVKKAATIKKRITTVSEATMAEIFPPQYAKLLAKGFFPIGFISKLYVLLSDQGGASLRAKIATVNGAKEIQFIRKIASGVDYNEVKQQSKPPESTGST